jgi:hypothetical protein
LLAGCACALAWQLQPTTAIAAGAGVVGLIAAFGNERGSALLAAVAKRPLLWVIGALLALGFGWLVAQKLGFFAQLRAVPLWDRHNADRVGYYFVVLARQLPLFWPLLPAAALTTLFSQRRLGALCIGILVAGFAIHSLAAQKAIRYVFYLMPFAAVLWGCALAAGVTFVTAAIARSTTDLGKARSLATGLALLLITSTITISQEGQGALRLLIANKDTARLLSFEGEADWSSALPILRPLAAKSSRVVVSNSMKALYYLGNYDFELNANGVDESESNAEFGRDARTGRGAISTLASIAQVIDKPGQTLVIVEQEKLGQASGVPEAVIRLLALRCSVVPVSAASGLSAWVCGSS